MGRKDAREGGRKAGLEDGLSVLSRLPSPRISHSLEAEQIKSAKRSLIRKAVRFLDTKEMESSYGGAIISAKRT